MDAFKRAVGSLPFRIFFAAAVPIGIAAALVFYIYNNPFICLFHEATNLYCPGCGAGRALFALMQFDIAAALGYNAVFVIFVPFAAYYFVKLYIYVILKKNFHGFFHRAGKIAGITLIILTAVFFILRNIPVMPFRLLAP